MSTVNSSIKIITLVCASYLLLACGSNDMQDLRKTLDDIEAKPKGRIPPPPEFKAFETFNYQPSGLRSPFERPLDIEIDTPITPGKIVKPDPTRRKEALERFSLDGMSFVGTLSKEKEGNELYALVDDGNGGVHRVQIGDYLGQNNGKVVTINKRKLELIEIVPNGQVDDDGNKLWMERPRSLVLRDE